MSTPPVTRSSLRRHILTFVGGLVLLSMVGSTVSIYRITEVNSALDAINGVSVPLGRLFAQMQSDAEILSRELERGLGYSHWKDEHWKPRPIPKWIQDVLQGEVQQARTLIRSSGEWAPPESKARWAEWAENINEQFDLLRTEADALHDALEKQDEQKALQIYPHWTELMEDWKRQLQWGAAEYERQIRQTFALAETRVSELKVGLEMILGTVLLLSLLMLWLGERALRPLAELTKLARSITRRGLRREDKALFPEIPLSRNDEVSQLAREFHRMATSLLEREKTVETQKDRLQDQNRMLRDMGALNENVLKSIDSILLVTDLQNRITQCNPAAVKFLGAKDSKEAVGTLLGAWSKPRPALLTRPKEVAETVKIAPFETDHRTYGGHWMPLRQQDVSHSSQLAGQLDRSERSDRFEMTGAVLVLDDMTDELDLQERLSRAENLAAVGRMSAQVAHEVRNPLHSIGLEAEMAVDLAAALPSHLASHSSSIALKQSLQSILRGVDRLDKITENYLKLSKLSTGQQGRVDLGDVLESVLATYTSACEAQGVFVDWHREQNAQLEVWGDRELLEQVFGNLMSNALQALESVQDGPKVIWKLGNTESGKVWIRIEDNGPGVSPEILPKLFTPFVTSKAQGTGLGLSFVKKVIEDQGGKIEYLARKKGACFEMIFPQQEERGAVSSNASFNERGEGTECLI